MGRPIIDLTGQRFGRLYVVKVAAGRYWLCKCDCGNSASVRSDVLRRGVSRSCGCLSMECRRARSVHGHAAIRSPEYIVWEGMHQRCADISARYYGALGIRVCDRWRSFENFLADMGSRPGPEYSIDRYPNQGGNYEPSNCRWATNKEQQRNMRNNLLVEYGGRRVPLAQAVEESGAIYHRAWQRLRRGWPIDWALS